MVRSVGIRLKPARVVTLRLRERPRYRQRDRGGQTVGREGESRLRS